MDDVWCTETLAVELRRYSNDSLGVTLHGAEHRFNEHWQMTGLYRGGDAFACAIDEIGAVVCAWDEFGALGAITAGASTLR